MRPFEAKQKNFCSFYLLSLIVAEKLKDGGVLHFTEITLWSKFRHVVPGVKGTSLELPTN